VKSFVQPVKPIASGSFWEKNFMGQIPFLTVKNASDNSETKENCLENNYATL